MPSPWETNTSYMNSPAKPFSLGESLAERGFNPPNGMEDFYESDKLDTFGHRRTDKRNNQEEGGESRSAEMPGYLPNFTSFRESVSFHRSYPGSQVNPPVWQSFRDLGT